MLHYDCKLCIGVKLDFFACSAVCLLDKAPGNYFPIFGVDENFHFEVQRLIRSAA